MFDIGFTELLLIAVVALVVLGPERLPKAARLAGLWARRARAQWMSVKSELERELAAEELKRSLHDARDTLQEASRQVEAEARAVETRVRDAEEDARREVEAMRRQVESGGDSDAAVTAQGEAAEQAAPEQPDLLEQRDAPDATHDGGDDGRRR